jgi:hypothetical protein
LSQASWVRLSVVVPAHALERMRVLADASGVSIDGFVAASLELRTRQHEGRSSLSRQLANLARQIDADREVSATAE